jgi:hypothetical protein
MYKFWFVLIAFVIYFIYNLISIYKFGIPPSLSDTYYLYKKDKSWKRFLFPIMMISMASLLMPAWIDLSIGSNFQFMSFLACAGIIFVGAAPTFKNSEMEYKVHSISAYFAALMAILWIILVPKMWYVILIVAMIIAFTSIVTKSIKISYIYWLETIAFLSTFIILFCLL